MNFGIDKVKHFVVGFIISAVVIFVAYHGLYYFDLYTNPSGKIIVALTQFIAVLVAGIWKETKDRKNGGIFDWWDIAFTMAPAVFFFVIVLKYF